MSYFLDAYSITLQHEGGYVNDPDDVGGETYKGIARAYNPSWGGWFVVDALRGSTDFPECLTDNKTLQLDVRKLYKSKYFDPYQGDAMPKDLALEMFDTAVNMGVGRAVTFLQKALNVLNRNQLLYPDMVEDGDYGPTTHKALQVLLNENGTEVLVKMLNVLQGMHYIEYMNKSPKQEKYARGWFSRVQIGK